MTIAANTINEKLLLASVASGNRDAFRQLYTTHLNKLHRYIFQFTRSKEETEEMLQDIFLKIWETREKLVDIDNFQQYLLRCAKNKVLDNLRHQQVRQRVLAEIKRTKNIGEAITNDDCAYREYYKVVQLAIDKLPAKRKVIFRLTIENGYSIDDIATQLNISRSVVEKQVYKATHAVREYLFKHGELSLPFLVLFLSYFIGFIKP